MAGGSGSRRVGFGSHRVIIPTVHIVERLDERTGPNGWQSRIGSSAVAVEAFELQPERLNCTLCECCWSRTTRRLPGSSKRGSGRRGLPSIGRPTAGPGSRKRWRETYDAAIVDVMLPQMDGLALIDALRTQGRPDAGAHPQREAFGGRSRPRPPGGRRRLPDQAVRLRRAAGARAGADPPRDRRGRADPAVRRRPLARPADPEGPARRAVASICGPREFALLEYLMRNAGRVVSKTSILSHVWGYNFDPSTNVVDVLVSRLRDRIDKPFPVKLLHTVRGVGYVLRPPS